MTTEVKGTDDVRIVQLADDGRCEIHCDIIACDREVERRPSSVDSRQIHSVLFSIQKSILYQTG